MTKVTGLNIYPLKSCAGLAVSEAQMVTTGLAHDRVMVVVTPDGDFLTARKVPKLLRVYVTPQPGGYTLAREGHAPLTVAIDQLSGETLEVSVWQGRISGHLFDAQADAWISNVLDRPARLAYFGPQSQRTSPYVGGGEVTFSDATPLLVISEASLEVLSQQVGRPLEMARFRPNIVVSGCDAYAEDGWARIRIGEMELRAVGPCSRCVLTTRDPVTGEKTKDSEPLKALARTRRGTDGAVYFGQNFAPVTTGILQIGKQVEVMETKSTELVPGEKIKNL